MVRTDIFRHEEAVVKEGTRRCVVYTRKSSEEGLEQAFNSLDAQREACEAYIKSQAHEGWQLVNAQYDDGGFSGGNVERPALKRLMGDVQRGRIDIIVVYKVDRLTRSLADFAKIVEVLDAHGASFVSITQQFNTTTSMGRLTLNVLLSFAQFEREVAGERIRDKIAASKRKGMWMGGNVLLGYDVVDRRLVPNENEAATVRSIFEAYLRLGTVARLQRYLLECGIGSKGWVSAKGRKRGGGIYSRGALYYLLRNPIYIGKIPHRGECYAGQHSPIVALEIWDRVQVALASRQPRGRGPRAKGSKRLLAGILYDDRDNLMSPSFTIKRDGSRYPCYVSQALLQNRKELAGSLARVPADVVERTVVEHTKDWLSRAAANQDHLHLPGRPVGLRDLIERVVLSRDGIRIFDRSGIQGSILVPGVVARKGTRLQFLEFAKPSRRLPQRPTAALLRAVCRASAWLEKFKRGEVSSYYDLARQEKFAPCYVRSNLQLAFLAPAIVEALLENRTTFCDGVVKLTSRRLPLSWFQQMTLLRPTTSTEATGQVADR